MRFRVEGVLTQDYDHGWRRWLDLGAPRSVIRSIGGYLMVVSFLMEGFLGKGEQVGSASFQCQYARIKSSRCRPQRHPLYESSSLHLALFERDREKTGFIED
jgi:hypothetical protein